MAWHYLVQREDCWGESWQDSKHGRTWEKWRIFVQLIQTIWDRGEILMQMSWMVVVLQPKGGGDFQGIDISHLQMYCTSALFGTPNQGQMLDL
jgi:hypothetical protein